MRQTAVADGYRGRVTGGYLTTAALTTAAGAGAAGLLGQYVGVMPLLMVQVLVYLLAGVLVLALLPVASRPSPAETVDSTARGHAETV